MSARGAGRGKEEGGPRRAIAASVAVVAATIFACGETSGLVLGEAPPSTTTSSTPPDSGPTPIEDAGCSTCGLSVALDGDSLTPAQGGTTGTAFTDTCPANEAVIGYAGFLTPPSVGLTLVGGIQATCGTLALGGASLGGVTTIAGATTPIRGTSQDAPWSQACPPGAVVVGFSGRSGSALDQVAFECAALTVSDDGGVFIGAVVTLTPAGGDGGSPFDDPCPAGQIARGGNGSSGEWVDEFGLVCGTPLLTSDAGGP